MRNRVFLFLCSFHCFRSLRNRISINFRCVYNLFILQGFSCATLCRCQTEKHNVSPFQRPRISITSHMSLPVSRAISPSIFPTFRDLLPAPFSNSLRVLIQFSFLSICSHCLSPEFFFCCGKQWFRTKLLLPSTSNLFPSIELKLNMKRKKKINKITFRFIVFGLFGLWVWESISAWRNVCGRFAIS